MSHHITHHASTAARGMCCMGVAWPGSGLESGLAMGLVVVDSNRPTIQPVHNAGFARRLRKQFGAAH